MAGLYFDLDSLLAEGIAHKEFRDEFEAVRATARQLLELATYNLGKAENDHVQRRIALNDFLSVAMTFVGGLIGEHMERPFRMIITALEDANKGIADPLLSPAKDHNVDGDVDRRHTRKPLAERATIAHCTALAEFLSTTGKGVCREVDKRIADILGMPVGAWQQQRRTFDIHEDDRVREENKEIYRCMKEAVIEVAGRRGVSTEFVADRLLHRMKATGGFVSKPTGEQTERVTSLVKK